MDGVKIASIEGFHQGIKYADAAERNRILGLSGIEAKRAGAKANKKPIDFFYWLDQKIPRGSKPYLDLYHRALVAKFVQNQEAMDALIATGEAKFSHKVKGARQKRISVEDFQNSHVCQSLYKIRDELTNDPKN